MAAVLLASPAAAYQSLLKVATAGQLAYALFACLLVCLFVLATPRYACGGTATSETTFPWHPEYTRVTAEETQCRIATSLPW